MIQLIHNQSAGPLPAGLALAYQNSIVPSDRLGILKCGRCGDRVADHLWIVRDIDGGEQDGVIDCQRIR